MQPRGRDDEKRNRVADRHTDNRQFDSKMRKVRVNSEQLQGKKYPAGIIILLLGLFATGGCVSMTPEYQAPELGVGIPGYYEEAAAGERRLETEDRWWEIFEDPELNRLVDEVLLYNWDVKQAAARVLETRARYYQVNADRYPQADIEAGYDRRKTGGARIDTGLVFDTYDASIGAAYEFDLWGRLKSNSRAAWDEILEGEESRKTVAQTVVAETVDFYLQIESLERRIQIAHQSIEAFQRSLDFVNIRYRRGLVSALDVRQARRILAGAEARLPQLRQELGTTQQRLAILLGRYPDVWSARTQPEEYYRPLPPIPPGLPSELLLRRPDIRAAEERLKAFNERIGAAKAARFPTITLTGNFGFASTELEDLIRSDNEVWNLTFRILQPLFDAGRLKAGQRAAEFRYQQEVAQYAKTVLTAFSEVEGALLTRKEQLDRRELFLKFLDEARETQKVAQDRYIRGLTVYLDVLDAQQVRFEAEENLVLVDLAIFSNRVELHRALGGGWANPDPLEYPDSGFSLYY